MKSIVGILLKYDGDINYFRLLLNYKLSGIILMMQ